MAAIDRRDDPVDPQGGVERSRPGRGRASATAWVVVYFAALARTAAGGTDRLTIEPALNSLTGAGARQQLAVTFQLADGSSRDVTSLCRFFVEPSTTAAVEPGGAIVAKADGRATVRAAFLGQVAECEVRVERGDVVSRASFRTDVVPLLSKAGCNMGACHGNSNGKGGFRLSLRGDDPSFDHLALTRDQLGRRVNPLAPERSLIVAKPTAQVAHEGGIRFARDSLEAGVLLGWIRAGARDDRAVAPRFKTLRVYPAERIAAAGSAGSSSS